MIIKSIVKENLDMENLTDEIKILNMAIIKRLFLLQKKNVESSLPSPLQFRIITFLEENKEKDISQKDLELNLNISKAAISEVLKTMEKKGIVKRIQFLNDARKNKIVLSDKSMKFYQQMINDIQILNEELIYGISKKQLLEFKKVIKIMQKNLKKEDI